MTDTITLDTPTSTEPTVAEPTFVTIPPAAAKGAKMPEKQAPRAKQTKALPPTVDPKIAALKAKREAAAKPLPAVLTGPAEPPTAAPAASKPSAPINNQTRFFTVRFVAAGSKLDPEAKVTFHDPTAGDRFNGEKNKARFRVGVASGKTTVGELLNLEGGPTSGDLRHWCEHSSEVGGTPWIEIDGMKYLPPRK